MVNESINEDQLTDAFSKVGSVKSCSISRGRNCAFVDFFSPESCQKALAQHKFPVNGHTVLAEERRYNNQNNSQNQNRYNNQSRNSNNTPFEQRRSNNTNSTNSNRRGQQQQQQNTTNNQQNQQNRQNQGGKGRGTPNNSTNQK